MISKFEEFSKLFEELDANIDKKVNFYVIGGAVMLYHNLKPITKDIDIVVDSIVEFVAVKNALIKMRFDSKVPTLEYKRFDLSQIFVRDDYRIDLFQKTVCNGFMLSDEMKKRALLVNELCNLNVFLCSLTDIFMFKTFTDRDGDLDDCISLSETEIDWNSMIKEIKQQIKISGHKVWITYIGERFDVLIDRNLSIPIMKEVDKLRIDFFDYLEDKQSKKN